MKRIASVFITFFCFAVPQSGYAQANPGIDHYQDYLETATSGEPFYLDVLSIMNIRGQIFPPNMSDGIRLAFLAVGFGWEYEKEYWDALTHNISKKKQNKLLKQAEACATPFDKECDISKPLKLRTVYLPTSDIELWRFNSGLILDTLKKENIEGLYNNFIGFDIGFPKIFSEKFTTFYSQKNKPNRCHVQGKDMDMIWFYNKTTPTGKYLEFHKKDELKFDCQKVVVN
jgi:hypothetical protein